MIKPFSGNSCDTCPKKFTCLTGSQQEICPIVSGKDISKYTANYWSNKISIKLVGRRFILHLSEEELLKILKKHNFSTTGRDLSVKEIGD